MFYKLIILLQFLAGIICLLGFLGSIFKKLLTKISLLALGLSAIGLGFFHCGVLKSSPGVVFIVLTIGAFFSLFLFAYSVLKREVLGDEPN